MNLSKVTLTFDGTTKFRVWSLVSVLVFLVFLNYKNDGRIKPYISNQTASTVPLNDHKTGVCVLHGSFNSIKILKVFSVTNILNYRIHCINPIVLPERRDLINGN